MGKPPKKSLTGSPHPVPIWVVSRLLRARVSLVARPMMTAVCRRCDALAPLPGRLDNARFLTRSPRRGVAVRKVGTSGPMVAICNVLGATMTNAHRDFAASKTASTRVTIFAAAIRAAVAATAAYRASAAAAVPRAVHAVSRRSVRGSAPVLLAVGDTHRKPGRVTHLRFVFDGDACEPRMKKDCPSWLRPPWKAAMMG
jgi:hypothetical protein